MLCMTIFAGCPWCMSTATSQQFSWSPIAWDGCTTFCAQRATLSVWTNPRSWNKITIQDVMKTEVAPIWKMGVSLFTQKETIKAGIFLYCSLHCRNNKVLHYYSKLQGLGGHLFGYCVAGWSVFTHIVATCCRDGFFKKPLGMLGNCSPAARTVKATLQVRSNALFVFLAAPSTEG